MMIAMTSHGHKSVRLDAHIDLAAETATYTVTDVDGHKYETADFKGAAQTYKTLSKKFDEAFAAGKEMAA